MKIKKWVPGMIALNLTAAALLAGCSQTSSNTNAGGTNNTAPADAKTPTDAAADKKDSAPAVKDGNITIMYFSSKDDYDKSKKDNPNAYDAIYETIPQFEQKYGGKVTVKVVPFDKERDTLISMVNSGEQMDVAPATDQYFPIYALKKIVQPIDQYIDVKDPAWNKAVTQAFSFGGKPYAVGMTAGPIVIYYNKTLFEKNGVKTPSEYYKEGNWTWDTFREVAKKMTMDTDGDGKTDQFGFNWWDGGLGLFVPSNGKTMLNYNADGTITSNLDSDNVKGALQFVQDGYLKDKFIDISKEGDAFVSDFKNGKLAMTAEYGLAGFKTYKSDYDIDIVPVPQGPMGSKDITAGGLGGYSIPTVSKNPTAAAAFIRMVAENDKKAGSDANVKAYGQERADLINQLSQKILFTPIGIEKYWDANTIIVKSLKDGTPVGTSTQQAKSLMDQGIKVTLTQ